MSLFPKELPPIVIKNVSKERVLAYGKAANDFNPLHFDEQTAKRFGYERCLAHGMLVCGMSTKLFSPWLDSRHFVKRFSVTFLRPLFVSDSVTISGKLQKNEPDEAIILITAKNGRNEVIMEGIATIAGGEAK